MRSVRCKEKPLVIYYSKKEDKTLTKKRKIVMTGFGAILLVLFSPVLLIVAVAIGMWLLIRTLIFLPRFRKSGFPGKFSPWLAGTMVFRSFCALPPEKRSGASYAAGDLPLLRLADGAAVAAPEAILFYRLTDKNAGTIGTPGEWVVDVEGAPPVNLSAFFCEAEEKALRPIIVTPDQPAVLPEDADAFRADARFVPLSCLSDKVQ